MGKEEGQVGFRRMGGRCADWLGSRNVMDTSTHKDQRYFESEFQSSYQYINIIVSFFIYQFEEKDFLTKFPWLRYSFLNAIIGPSLRTENNRKGQAIFKQECFPSC